MKLSFQWLKSLFPTDKPAEEIAALLTSCGLEVEGIEEVESIKGGLKGLVIGHVVEKEKHPDADRLSLTKVDTGKDELLQIVCGAPNVAAGQKVIVAPVGTFVHPTQGEAFEIKKAKIRGQLSEGMICADDEVGLGDSHDGIRVLPNDAPVGMSAAQYFKIENDQVLEIGLTPNRGDAASVLGVARDLKALTGESLKLTEYHPLSKNGSNPVDVKVLAPEDCLRYSGVYIKNTRAVESPDWLKNRLKAIGIKPRNILVDATNYTLHELGQPIHAFDADKIDGNIIVRKASPGEKMITLDEVERSFEGNELLICDEKKPLAIAGVFGGLQSGVSEQTVNVFIESAYFSPASIRKTAKKQGLNTDASFRYERGTDPEITLYAMRKVVALIMEFGGGEIDGGEIDVYPNAVLPHTFSVNTNEIRRLSGANIPDEKIETILSGLDIGITKEINSWKLNVPARKHDVTRQADIVEEVLRIYGYDNVPLTGNMKIPQTSPGQSYQHQWRKKISTYLASVGFNELLTNSLTSFQFQSNAENNVVVLNPLSSDLGVLRDNLLSSALQAAAFNQNRKRNNLRFFEFGKTYNHLNSRYEEEERLLLLIAGNRTEESWATIEKPVDYFYLKGLVQNIFILAGRPVKPEKDTKWVSIEKVPQNMQRLCDVKGELWYADIAWGKLMAYPPQQGFKVVDIPKFPEVRRDLSLVLDKSVQFEQIESISKKLASKYLQRINLFDVYEGKNIDEDKKSYAITFLLNDAEKTLTDKEIEGTMTRLIEAFEKELGAVIRR